MTTTEAPWPMDIRHLATEATARALHRWKHPSFKFNSPKCHCMADAAWAIEETWRVK